MSSHGWTAQLRADHGDVQVQWITKYLLGENGSASQWLLADEHRLTAAGRLELERCYSTDLSQEMPQQLDNFCALAINIWRRAIMIQSQCALPDSVCSSIS